jgi:hypothetical protein
LKTRTITPTIPTQTGPEHTMTTDADSPIDVVAAINALEELTHGNETRNNSTTLYFDKDGFSLVGAALNAHGVPIETLILLGPLRIEYLYERNLLPVKLTLGAAMVYRAAQRTQDGQVGTDRSWGAAFDNAVVAAGRVIDLLPDAVVTAASAELVSA